MQKYVGREKTAAFFKQLKLQLSVQASVLRKYLMYKSGTHPPSHLREGGETLCLSILSIRAGWAEADPNPLGLVKLVNPVTQLLGATAFAYPTGRF